MPWLRHGSPGYSRWAVPDHIHRSLPLDTHGCSWVSLGTVLLQIAATPGKEQFSGHNGLLLGMKGA